MARENRLAELTEAAAIFQNAKSKVEAGDFERALPLVVEYFSNFDCLLFPEPTILQILKTLTANYPIAVEQLGKLSKQLEGEIVIGNSSRKSIANWIILNQSLGDDEHIVQVYKRLNQSDALPSKEVQDLILSVGLSSFLRTNSADLASEVIGSIGPKFWFDLASLESEKLFSPSDRPGQEYLRKQLEEQLALQGIRLFELALRINFRNSDLIRSRCLEIVATLDAFVLFAKTARKLENKKEMESISLQAELLLAEKDYDAFSEELRSSSL